MKSSAADRTHRLPAEQAPDSRTDPRTSGRAPGPRPGPGGGWAGPSGLRHTSRLHGTAAPPRGHIVWDPRAPALDRGRAAEVAARVIAEAEPGGPVAPALRESASAVSRGRAPSIPPGKAERRERLGNALQTWDGPDSAKSRILEAFAEDDFFLNLQNENLASLPEGLHLLTHMGHLDVKNNPLLQRLPEDLALAPRLGRLQATGCDLHALPRHLPEAKGLVMLEVAGNRNLRSLPDGMDRLEALQTVELAHCDLSRLPEGGFGPGLKSLALSGNRRLVQLPSAIGKSQRLEFLALRDCGLRRLPSAIGQLPRLRSLDVAGNRELEELPPGIDFEKVHVGTRETRVRLMDSILNHPLAPDTRAEHEEAFKTLRTRWQGLQKQMAEGGAETARHADAARRAVDARRAGLSNTVRSTTAAGENWNAAARQVQAWAGQGRPLDTEHLKRLNAMLGKDLQPFDDPEALEKFGARFGEFRRQPTGFPQGRQWGAVVDEREIGAEMAHFDAWFASQSAQVAHGTMTPVELAAATAQRLVSIHPFPDANGRTARLAADGVLASHGLPPSACENRWIAVYSDGRNRQGPEDALHWMTRGLAETIALYEQELGASSSRS